MPELFGPVPPITAVLLAGGAKSSVGAYRRVGGEELPERTRLERLRTQARRRLFDADPRRSVCSFVVDECVVSLGRGTVDDRVELVPRDATCGRIGAGLSGLVEEACE